MRSLTVVELGDGRRFALPKRTVESGGLAPGIALLPGTLDELAVTQSQAAYDLAFRRLCRSECSAAEIVRYLTERGFASECATTTVERLLREHAIDDARAAESHVAVRGARGGRGQRFVRQELAQRGIGASIAEAATQSLDDEASAYEVALARAQRRNWADATAFATSVGPFLQRRGFEYETVRRALKAAWQEAERARQDAATFPPPPR